MAEPGGRGRLNAAVRRDIENAVLCWLASVDADGMPNVTPKEIFAAHGEDMIVIADIASTNSVRNIRAHPKVCVSFVDIFRQRGFKIAGTARVIAPDQPDFAGLAGEVLAKAGPDFPVRNLIAVRVDKISRIWAPSYALFPDRSEAERMEAAYATYGVRPLPS